MISKTILRAQLLVAKNLGYLEKIRKASNSKWPVHILMGIASRETNLNPLWNRVPGDHGNGHGLFQIDKRFHYDWVQKGLWKDPYESALKAIQVLNELQDRAIMYSELKLVTATTLQGRGYTTATRPIDNLKLLPITIASYNCGLWAYYHYCKGRDVDTGTTGADYSKDVLYRAEIFKQLI